MNPANEFEKYAVKHRGISSNTLNDYNKYLVTEPDAEHHRGTPDECGRHGRLQPVDDGPDHLPRLSDQ